MALDTLEVFGTEYTDVAGFKATDDNGQTKTYIRPQGTVSITSSGTTDVTEYASASVAAGTAGTPVATKGAVNTATITVTPSVTNTAGLISGGTITGTGVLVTARELVSGNTVYIDDADVWDVAQAEYADVPAGTAGTPTATKGTVNNHAITVTPSVTNTGGWINGGTKTGTGVSVSASELVSGSQNITTNNTYDVTNLASVVVNVSGGGGKNIQAYLGQASRTANSYGATTVTLTVAKTGTYKVSWTAWRSSSSGTMGTNLHRNSTSGTNQQTWTGTYGQRIELSNQSYTQGDVLTLYATSGSNSRTVYVGNLIIEEQ